MTTTATDSEARGGAHARRRFWTRVWMLMFGSALAYLPVALAPNLIHAVARRTDELAYDRSTPVRSGVLTTLTMGEAAAVLGVLAALVIALNLIAWSLGPAITAEGSSRSTEALRLEHLELCGSVFGVGATMTFVAALLDGLPHAVDLAALLLFPAVFVIVVLSQDLFLATQRGVGARRRLRREASLLRRRELLATAARLRPADSRAAGHPFAALAVELALLAVVTVATGLLMVVVFDDESGSGPLPDSSDVVFVVVMSAITMFTAAVLVLWTVRCWLLRRYVGAVLAAALGGTLYVVVGAGIVWAALDEDAVAEAIASAAVLYAWIILPAAVLLLGTVGFGRHGRFPGVTAALRAAVLRERYRVRRAEVDGGRRDGRAEGSVPPLRHLIVRARTVARAAPADRT
ncbi:hypothetical protein [Rhodococcus rhodochrous]|uniref:hypothetical protein n=1 Tax=Rhodococcus rhodochrous TaxID=1829 RepID=UPI0032DEC499